MRWETIDNERGNPQSASRTASFCKRGPLRRSCLSANGRREEPSGVEAVGITDGIRPRIFHTYHAKPKGDFASMERIEVTKEMLLGARDYLSLGIKEAWVRENAEKCFDRLAITADDEPMPPMYAVNGALKSRYLMAAFVAFYLRQDYEALKDDTALMSEEEYDRWAGSHVFNQIERWKRDSDLRDKCYDLLYDYRDLEKRFTAQIVGLLTVQNDSVIRQNELTASQMKELPAVLEQLKELQKAREGEPEDGTADSAV